MPVAKHQMEPILKGINDLIRRSEKSKVPILYNRNEFERKQILSNLLRKFTASLKAEGVYFFKNKADGCI